MVVKLPYLNLGCGYHYHPDWVNLDFIQSGPDVIAHNLTEGVPFNDGNFEVVYHSHVLEHFSKQQANMFMRECYRVLRKGGIIRVVVPDLSQIIANYQRLLSLGLQNPEDETIKADYDWIMLELYDQTVRHKTGGDMAAFLFRDHVPNLSFVLERIGHEGKTLRETYLRNKSNSPAYSQTKVSASPSLAEKIKFVTNNPVKFAKSKLKKWLFAPEQAFYEANSHYTDLGKFRLGGEVHQWMYDAYSLGYLLRQTGFDNVKTFSATTSRLDNWASFELDTVSGVMRKPDSLFMEATK
jgi:predicted SAM-dependent methyltransferase